MPGASNLLMMACDAVSLLSSPDGEGGVNIFRRFSLLLIPPSEGGLPPPLGCPRRYGCVGACRVCPSVFVVSSSSSGSRYCTYDRWRMCVRVCPSSSSSADDYATCVSSPSLFPLLGPHFTSPEKLEEMHCEASFLEAARLQRQSKKRHQDLSGLRSLVVVVASVSPRSLSSRFRSFSSSASRPSAVVVSRLCFLRRLGRSALSLVSAGCVLGEEKKKKDRSKEGDSR